MEATETTIQSPDTLNPRKILQAPSPQRPQMLEEFRGNLLSNKLALSKTIQDLTHFIRYYPDANNEQLHHHLDHLPTQTNLTSDQREIIEIGLGIYQQRHKALKDFREQFPDDEEGDKSLFSTLFGRLPKGEIEVKQGPITLYFRCHNEDDFALIYGQSFGTGELNEVQKSKARQSGGVLIYYQPIPSLKHSIAAENANGLNTYESNGIFIHEEQHSIMRLFQEAYTEYRSKHQDSKSSTVKAVEKLVILPTPDIEEVISLVTQAKNPHEAQELIYNLLRKERQQIEENKVKDEMLAFVKQGTSIRDIDHYLTKPASEGGLYDFFDKDSRQELMKDLMKGLSSSLSPVISKAVDDVFVNEYQQILEDCKTAVIILQKNSFSKEEIVNLLINEPFEDWRLAVERLRTEKIKQDSKSLFSDQKAA